MNSTNRITGLDIMDNHTGEKIGVVKDLIFSKKRFRILAIVVSEGGFFKEEKIIQYKNIYNIGKDFISVEKHNIIENLKDYPEIERESECDNDIIGLQVLIDDGESIGYINDIVFESKNGNIIAFVLTDGVIQDILDGRNVVPYTDDMKLTDNALIVDKKFKDNFEKNKLNFKKLLELDW